MKAIIEERKENGNLLLFLILAKRVDLRAANKKAFDRLIIAGGFDSFKIHIRAQYFAKMKKA